LLYYAAAALKKAPVEACYLVVYQILSLVSDFCGLNLLLQNLGKDPEALRWYVQAELVHCRTAMAGVAGILIPAVSSSSSNSNSLV
jgi:hypothetical protein